LQSRGVGLEIEGFKDVFVHGVTPEVLEKLVTHRDGKLEVPVVKKIPAEIVGQGAGRSSPSNKSRCQFLLLLPIQTVFLSTADCLL
jgi:hypothetical protein